MKMDDWKPSYQEHAGRVNIQKEATMSTNDGFKVEKGIAIPGKHGGISKYPWQQMQIDDSFFIACANDARRNVQRAAYMNGKAYVKKHRPSSKVATRLEDGGVRIWLVAK